MTEGLANQTLQDSTLSTLDNLDIWKFGELIHIMKFLKIFYFPKIDNLIIIFSVGTIINFSIFTGFCRRRRTITKLDFFLKKKLSYKKRTAWQKLP